MTYILQSYIIMTWLSK